ncbi:hypothetical protein C8Q74DRAFT_1315322 [Fomes fomentarius]|nr:hypothetical protein C8Q74DRAFT_1315322 [Fomes fomentarius]
MDRIRLLSQQFRNLTSTVDISCTRFCRTTDKSHCDAVSHLWSSHAGWYSVSNETLHAGRATQEGRCREGETDKFHLSAFREFLSAHYASHPQATQPQQFHVDIVSSLQEPLEDLSISRKRSRLAWGIPVSNVRKQTIYVWIDVLTYYLSFSSYPWKSVGGDGTSHGWPPNVQVIGKDILRYGPLDLPLTSTFLALPHRTVDRAKISKSVGNEQLQKHSREIISLFDNLFLRATSRSITRSVLQVKRPNVKLISEYSISTPILRAFQVTDVIEATVQALSEVCSSNLLMTDAAPWSSETSANIAAEVQAVIFETLRQCGILLQPVMPGKFAILLYHPPQIAH